MSEYAAAKSLKVLLRNVAPADSVKLFWTDGYYMPLSSPVLLRMRENGAEAYEQFSQKLAVSLRHEDTSGASDSDNPYALARLLVSCDTLPDLSQYKGKVTVISGPDNLHVLQFYDPAVAVQCEQYLQSVPSVRYVEPDSVITANTSEANGASTALSWGVSKTGIGAYTGNLRARGDTQPVIVAVVDSGVERNHPLLKDRLIPGYDFVQYDETPQDENGHGTHVAGTVLDCTPGMDIRVMPVRVLNAFGTGTRLGIASGI